MAENETAAVLASSADKFSETLSETTSENQTVNSPAPYESNPRGNADSQTSFSEKIRESAGGLFEKFGVPFKKGRGRPRKDGQPGKADVVLASGESGNVAGTIVSQPAQNGVAVAAAVAPAPVDSARAAMFRKACCAAVKGLLGILSAVVKTYATAAGIREVFSTRVLKNAEPTPTDLAEFTDSLDAVLKKHSIEPKNTEEIALAINTAKLLAPFAMLIAEFRGEIRRQRDEKGKSTQPEK